MSRFREAYTALNPSSPRTEVLSVLVSIITGLCFLVANRCVSIVLTRFSIAQKDDIDDTNRAALVQSIIDDLTSLAKGSKQSRLTTKGTLQYEHSHAYLTCTSRGR